MPTFRNLNDLSKFFKSSTFKNTTLYAGFSQQALQNALKESANSLKSHLQNGIEEYYASYRPKVYERTYRLLDSLKVSPITQVGNILSIMVYFDDDMHHPSYFNGEDAFVPVLLTEGWSWKNPDSRYHLSWYSYPQGDSYGGPGSGHPFVDDSIENFNMSNNKYKFKIIRESKYSGTVVSRKEWN